MMILCCFGISDLRKHQSNLNEKQEEDVISGYKYLEGSHIQERKLTVARLNGMKSEQGDAGKGSHNNLFSKASSDNPQQQMRQHFWGTSQHTAGGIIHHWPMRSSEVPTAPPHWRL